MRGLKYFADAVCSRLVVLDLSPWDQSREGRWGHGSPL